jgi:hypothetical protein
MVVLNLTYPPSDRLPAQLGASCLAIPLSPKYLLPESYSALLSHLLA